MAFYFQCKLVKDTETTIAWIEQRGAKVGNVIELILEAEQGHDPISEGWSVVEVYQPAIEYKDLREKQRKDRKSLPSIKNV